MPHCASCKVSAAFHELRHGYCINCLAKAVTEAIWLLEHATPDLQTFLKEDKPFSSKDGLYSWITRRKVLLEQFPQGNSAGPAIVDDQQHGKQTKQ